MEALQTDTVKSVNRNVVIPKKQHNLKKRDIDRNLWDKIKQNKESYVLVAPFMILFTTFTIIPVVSSIVLSFTNFNILQMPKFIGWNNYQRLLLYDDVFLIAVKNTLVFAFITGPISYVACFIFAWFINELSRRLKAFMTLIFYAPSISGSVYLIWQFIFSGDQYGVVNGILMKFGLLKEPIQWLTDTKYDLKIVILVQIWLSLGASFLAFIAGFKNVDCTLYEVGAIEGIKNRWQELYHITIPQMKPHMMFGAVMQIASSFAVGAVPEALTGFPSTDYSTHTIISHIHDYGSVRYEMGYASAIASVLFICMLLVYKVIHNTLKQD